MAKAVSLAAVRTVMWPVDVTGSQGSVKEGVKLDGRNQPVIQVREEACAWWLKLLIKMQYFLYMQKLTNAF